MRRRGRLGPIQDVTTFRVRAAWRTADGPVLTEYRAVGLGALGHLLNELSHSPTTPHRIEVTALDLGQHPNRASVVGVGFRAHQDLDQHHQPKGVPWLGQ